MRVVALVSDLMDRSRISASVPSVTFVSDVDGTTDAEIIVIDLARHGRAVAEVRAEMARIAEANRTPVSVETIAADQPVPMDPAVVGIIEGACRRLGIRCRRMPSGAGHDAMNMARIAPAGMIFIPCRGGISHNPDEYASPEDILTGVDALTETLYDLAR